MKLKFNFEKNLQIEWFEELDESDLNGKLEYKWMVDCHYTPFFPGGRGEYGQRLEPDEPANVDIQQAVCKDTGEVLDGDQFIERFGEDCIEYFIDKVYEEAEDAYEAYGDRLYDEMKDREFDLPNDDYRYDDKC